MHHEYPPRGVMSQAQDSIVTNVVWTSTETSVQHVSVPSLRALCYNSIYSSIWLTVVRSDWVLQNDVLYKYKWMLLGRKAEVERIQAAAKHLGIDGDVVPFGSHTNTLPGAKQQEQDGRTECDGIDFTAAHTFGIETEASVLQN